MTGAVQSLIDRGRALAARNDQSLRFLIAGAVNTAFGLASYPVLLWSSAWLREHYMVGLGIAQVVSLCFSFATYKLAVFRSNGSVAREAGIFSSFYLMVYATNWLALPVLVRGLRLDPVVAQLSFTVVMIVASYFWHSRVTFKPARDS